MTWERPRAWKDRLFTWILFVIAVYGVWHMWATWPNWPYLQAIEAQEMRKHEQIKCLNGHFKEEIVHGVCGKGTCSHSRIVFICDERGGDR